MKSIILSVNQSDVRNSLCQEKQCLGSKINRTFQNPSGQLFHTGWQRPLFWSRQYT